MATYSIYKKRWYKKDKLLSTGMSLEKAESEMKAWKKYSNFSCEHYYMSEDTETHIYHHTWSLTVHPVFGDIYCTKCFLPKAFAEYDEHKKCLYD